MKIDTKATRAGETVTKSKIKLKRIAFDLLSREVKKD